MTRPSAEDPLAGDLAKRALLRAILPVIIGFLLLLAVVFALGWRSAREMENVGANARESAFRYSAQVKLLLDLRLALTKLDNEARMHEAAYARRELMPPFDFKLNKARGEFKGLWAQMGRPPSLQEGNWRKLQEDLQTYIQITEDGREYSLKGFKAFSTADLELNDLIGEVLKSQESVVGDVVKLQNKARKSIEVFTLIALIVGALVAAGTIWQVQHHFWRMRSSMLEARRERTFTTQLLEGMVSAVAAIDEEDRIRSANAAFFHIFPKASVGASVLEHFASTSSGPWEIACRRRR